MRFWIIVWSFVIAFFGLQTINMFKESNEYTIAMGALTILAIFMWLYSFIHIIVLVCKIINSISVGIIS